MTRFVLDTNLYIAADRDRAKAEELVAFYAAFLPVTYLHAIVVQELLVGAINPHRRQRVRDAYVRPFESRRRVVTPTFANWARSGEVIGQLVHRRIITIGGLARSFLNDVLLAVSCRAAGMTLVTTNIADFERIRRVEPVDFVPPWPTT
jgi:predicted nucleic acid-binding protein